MYNLNQCATAKVAKLSSLAAACLQVNKKAYLQVNEKRNEGNNSQGKK